MLPQTKEECIAWQQGVLDKTQQMVVEEHLRYVETKAKLDKALRLIYNLEHVPEGRRFSINEYDLATLGWTFQHGKIVV